MDCSLTTRTAWGTPNFGLVTILVVMDTALLMQIVAVKRHDRGHNLL